MCRREEKNEINGRDETRKGMLVRKRRVERRTKRKGLMNRNRIT